MAKTRSVSDDATGVTASAVIEGTDDYGKPLVVRLVLESSNGAGLKGPDFFLFEDLGVRVPERQRVAQAGPASGGEWGSVPVSKSTSKAGKPTSKPGKAPVKVPSPELPFSVKATHVKRVRPDDETFKRVWAESGESAKRMADALGVPEHSVWTWLRALRATGVLPVAGKASGTPQTKNAQKPGSAAGEPLRRSGKRPDTKDFVAQHKALGGSVSQLMTHYGATKGSVSAWIKTFRAHGLLAPPTPRGTKK